MKTFFEVLKPNYKFDHQLAEKMASSVKKYAENGKNFKNSTAVALRRITVLTFNYMDNELNNDEFTPESFFKLLFCEVHDISYLTHRNTVFDILMQDGSENSAAVNNMYLLYRDYRECMPGTEDAMHFFLDAFDILSDKYKFEYDREKMTEFWKALRFKKTGCPMPEPSATPTFFSKESERFLAEFKKLRESGDSIHVRKASEILKGMNPTNDDEQTLLNGYLKMLDIWKQYNDMMSSIFEEN